MNKGDKGAIIPRNKNGGKVESRKINRTVGKIDLGSGVIKTPSRKNLVLTITGIQTTRSLRLNRNLQNKCQNLRKGTNTGKVVGSRRT